MLQLFLSQYTLMKPGELTTDISTLPMTRNCNLYVSWEGCFSQDLLLTDNVFNHSNIVFCVEQIFNP